MFIKKGDKVRLVPGAEAIQHELFRTASVPSWIPPMGGKDTYEVIGSMLWYGGGELCYRLDDGYFYHHSVVAPVYQAKSFHPLNSSITIRRLA